MYYLCKRIQLPWHGEHGMIRACERERIVGPYWWNHKCSYFPHYLFLDPCYSIYLQMANDLHSFSTSKETWDHWNVLTTKTMLLNILNWSLTLLPIIKETPKLDKEPPKLLRFKPNTCNLVQFVKDVKKSKSLDELLRR